MSKIVIAIFLNIFNSIPIENPKTGRLPKIRQQVLHSPKLQNGENDVMKQTLDIINILFSFCHSLTKQNGNKNPIRF